MIVSDAIANGSSANVVGELLRNSLATIARFYDDLPKKRESMLEVTAKAIGGSVNLVGS